MWIVAIWIGEIQLHICVTCTNNWFVVVLCLNKSKGFDIVRHKTMMNDQMKNAIENIKQELSITQDAVNELIFNSLNM